MSHRITRPSRSSTSIRVATAHALRITVLLATSLVSLAACGSDGPSSPNAPSAPRRDSTITTTGGATNVPPTPPTAPTLVPPAFPTIPPATSPSAPPAAPPVAPPAAPPTIPSPTATTGIFTGTVTLSPAYQANGPRSRVAIYKTIEDRHYDRLVKQTMLAGTGANFTFTMTDVPPGTYYVDLCALPITTTSCVNPTPDNPITIVAGRTTTWNFNVVPR